MTCDMLLTTQEAPPSTGGKVKRPATAYTRFVAENFNSVAAANPDLKGVGPVGKLLGKQWATMPEAEKVGSSAVVKLVV